MTALSKKIEDKLKELPTQPGIYIFIDAKGKILYIGKAKNLKSRVTSYFRGGDTRYFVKLLGKVLQDIEIIVTNTEKEALLLENELIKKNKPKFNIKLVDDKHYLCIRIDTKHPYPRLEIRRQFAKDGAKYFGPYSSASAIRRTLTIVNRHFQLRTCSDNVLSQRTKPCLQFQIKRCPAPCAVEMSSDVYGKNVKRTLQFLNGDQKELIHELERAMLQHSETLEFEAAAAIRDQIKAIEKSLEKQNVLSTDLKDRDLIGLHRQGPTTQIYTLMIRAGRMQQSKSYFFPDLEIDTESLLEDFVHQYYLRAKMLPQEIILPLPLDLSTLTTVIKEQKGQHVAFHHPLRGSKVRLLEIVNKNAKQALTETLTRKSDNRDHLKQTQKLLKLKNLPERVECIDISHHQGDNIVGSCVCFLHGKPAKKLYKRYKIRSTSTQDDYKSIYEVVSRRLRRGLENSDLPTLLVIDGGKGQLKSAEAALIDHGVEDLELIALAKSRLKKEKGRQHYYSPERVFKCDMKDPIALPRHSTTTMLVTQIRDEAHRFAIEYQRMLARNKNRRSVLDDIPGIGPKRRNLLLKKFGSVKNLKERTKNEIETLLGPKLTQSLLAALRDLH